MREPVILLQFLAKLSQIKVKLGNDYDIDDWLKTKKFSDRYATYVLNLVV